MTAAPPQVWPVIGKTAVTAIVAVYTIGPAVLLTMDCVDPGPRWTAYGIAGGVLAGACWLIWGVA